MLLTTQATLLGLVQPLLQQGLVQTLERWKSLAFTTYIGTPVEDLMAASVVLASPPRG